MNERTEKIKALIVEAKNAATLNNANFGFPDDRIEVKAVHFGNDRTGRVRDVIHPTDYVKKITEPYRGSWIIRPLKEAADEMEKLEGEVVELETENARLRDEYVSACKLVADMHAAAIGGTRSPIVGVVEDVANLYSENERLKEAIEWAANMLERNFDFTDFAHQFRARAFPPQFEVVEVYCFVCFDCNTSFAYDTDVHECCGKPTTLMTGTIHRPIVAKTKRWEYMGKTSSDVAINSRKVPSDVEFYAEWFE